MKQKLQILRTLHTFLQANDIENFMVALKAVMCHNFITWSDNPGVREEWQRYGFDHSTVEDYFKFEVDTIAMDRYFWRFEDLCERTMDFSMVGLVKTAEIY